MLLAFTTGNGHLKLVQKGAKKETNLRANLVKKRPPQTMDDFCDKNLCKFFGEEKARKHVACVKDVRSHTFLTQIRISLINFQAVEFVETQLSFFMPNLL